MPSKQFNHSPRLILTLLLLLVSVQISICLLLVKNQPWFGIEVEWQSEAKSHLVTGIHDNSPLKGQLETGDSIQAIINNSKDVLPLNEFSFVRFFDNFQTFQRYKEFQRHHGKLHHFLHAPGSQFLTNRGTIPVAFAKNRPIITIPLSFWISNLTGAAGLFIGFLFWVYSKNSEITRWLRFNAIMFWGISTTYCIPNSMGLIIHPDILHISLLLNHAAQYFYSFSILAILWLFPNPVNRLPVIFFMLPPTLLLINQALTISELPINSFFLYVLFVYGIGLSIIALQWHRTRIKPEERAALKWVVLSILLTISITLSLTFFPLILGNNSIAPDWVSHGAALFLYIGLALGVVKYRLFDLERWWIKTVIWFFSGLALVITDLFLIYVLGVDKWSSMGLSLVLLGWLYFPVRQYTIDKLMTRQKADSNALITQLVSELLLPGQQNNVERWSVFVNRIYNPLATTVEDNQHGSQIFVSNNGVTLSIPSISEAHRINLEGREQGQLLFNSEDLALIKSLHQMSKSLVDVKNQITDVRKEERSRIAMDLHDDVAPLMLNIIHHPDAQTNSETARKALKLLKEIIYNLTSADYVSIKATRDLMEREILEQTSSLSFEPRLQGHIADHDHLISQRLKNNALRIIRESLVNTVVHAKPTFIEICYDISSSGLCWYMAHDGNIEPRENWELGRGVLNIESRAAEHNGYAKWEVSPNHLKFTFALTF